MLESLTKQQQQLLKAVKSGKYRRVVWFGSIRSGKTVGCAAAMLMKAEADRAAKRGNGQYIIVSRTLGSIQRDIRPVMVALCKELGLDFKESKSQTSPNYVIGGRYTFHLFGASDSTADDRISGMTSSGAWIDEATRCDILAIEQTEFRCSTPGSMILMSTNTNSPFHPVKMQYIDEAGPETLVMESVPEDNHHLPAEIIAEYRKGDADSSMFRRNVENMWVPDSGLVYPFDHTHLVDPLEVNDPTRWQILGLDFGVNGITAGVLFQSQGPGRYAVVDEYTHSGLMSESDHARRLKAKWRIDRAVVDPSAPGMIQALREVGVPTERANNDILTGVAVVNNNLYNGQLKLCRHLKKLLGTMSAYSWNEDTGKPIKVDDHHCDALRYGAYAALPLYRGGFA